PRAHLEVGLGLEELKLVEDLEGNVGQLARAVRAFRVEAPEVDVGKVVVGPAFGRGDAHFRRGGRVVDLDPEAGEELLRLFAGQAALGDVALVEGREMLVQVAGVHGVPAVELGYRAEVGEPVALEGLPEIARRLGRNAGADLGDPEQL